jgi:hypothetical protein
MSNPITVSNEAVKAAAKAAVKELHVVADEMSVPFSYADAISIGNYRMMRAAREAAAPFIREAPAPLSQAQPAPSVGEAAAVTAARLEALRDRLITRREAFDVVGDKAADALLSDFIRLIYEAATPLRDALAASTPEEKP